MTVELLYERDCPNVGEARANLRRALTGAGLPASWTERELSAAAVRSPLRAFGSPTVLVNGRDVAGAAPGDAACCRVYEVAGGRSGAPPAELIVRALRAALERQRRGRGRVAFALPAAGAAIVPGLTCPACWPAYGTPAHGARASLRPDRPLPAPAHQRPPAGCARGARAPRRERRAGRRGAGCIGDDPARQVRARVEPDRLRGRGSPRGCRIASTPRSRGVLFCLRSRRGCSGGERGDSVNGREVTSDGEAHLALPGLRRVPERRGRWARGPHRRGRQPGEAHAGRVERARAGDQGRRAGRGLGRGPARRGRRRAGGLWGLTDLVGQFNPAGRWRAASRTTASSDSSTANLAGRVQADEAMANELTLREFSQRLGDPRARSRSTAAQSRSRSCPRCGAARLGPGALSRGRLSGSDGQGPEPIPGIAWLPR